MKKTTLNEAKNVIFGAFWSYNNNMLHRHGVSIGIADMIELDSEF